MTKGLVLTVEALSATVGVHMEVGVKQGALIAFSHQLESCCWS